MANDVRIVVIGDDKFSGTASKVKQSAAGLETGMGGLGKTMAGVGGGFIAAQVGMSTLTAGISKSIGAAMAYEAQFAEIRALTGATKQDTDQLSVAIKGMSSELAKSPAELAAASYFILSSGISDTADAAEVLEIAAKASAVGLGETTIVADALTTVLNAYSKETSEAGQVTDVLMQAVKDGKAEADAFAGVLGRVVPIASQMGISFEEVAANLATFTRLGVSAEEAATGLRGVMNAMLKPSEEAEEALAGVGLSMAQVRAEVKEKGLAAVLQTLIERFHGNTEEIAKLFPEVRGLTNVLATAGVQGDAYAEILGNMDTATGNLDRGFEEVSATTQFQLNKALNELNLELMELGEKSLPAVVQAARALGVGVDVLGAATSALGEDTRDADERTGGFKDTMEAFGRALLNPLAGQKALHEELTATGAALHEVIPLTLEQEKRLVDLKFAQMDAEDGFKDVGDAAKGEFTDGILTAIETIDTLTEKADTARDALLKMFKEPTKEEVAAEAVLANYELQLSTLTDTMTPLTDAQNTWLDSLGLSGDAAEIAELKARGLTDAEAAMFLKLQNDLIPEQEDHLDLLGKTRDAAGAEALAKFGTFATQDAWNAKIGTQTGTLHSLMEKMHEFERDYALVTALQIHGLSLEGATQKALEYKLALQGIIHTVPLPPSNYNPGLPNPGQGPPGGYAHGLWSVPGSGSADSFPAMLAPGEMVLPRLVAESVRSSEPSSTFDYDRLAQVLLRALQGLVIQADGREIGRLAMAYGGNATDLLRRGG